MNKNKIISLLILVLLPVAAAFSSVNTDKNWTQQLKSVGIAAQDQAYCYTNDQGKVEGVNVDMLIRLASVSKLLTSFWAVDVLGSDYKFNTLLFIKGKNLHIAGSFDPFMGNEKMFYLISQLNDLGFNNFDTITFDKNVMIYPTAAYEVDEYPTMNAASNARYLKMYFNTRDWSADSKKEYYNYYNLAKAGTFRKDVNFTALNIKFVDKNPFENDSEARVLTLSSPAIYKYLKEVNVKSNNYVAETIFRKLGGVNQFEKFLADRFSLSSDKIHFYSGSGLPTNIDGNRKDNYATCSVMLDLISEFKISVEKQNKKLEDLIAVPGSDKGTFRNRIFPSDYKNSFVAKTGTLMHTSTLAGAMNTQKGFSFFGIFNQSTDITGSKTVQNSMVKSIMTEMGGPKTFEYQVEGFHAYTDEAMKGLNQMLEIDHEESFSTLGGALY